MQGWLKSAQLCEKKKQFRFEADLSVGNGRACAHRP